MTIPGLFISVISQWSQVYSVTNTRTRAPTWYDTLPDRVTAAWTFQNGILACMFNGTCYKWAPGEQWTFQTELENGPRYEPGFVKAAGMFWVVGGRDTLASRK